MTLPILGQNELPCFYSVCFQEKKTIHSSNRPILDTQMVIPGLQHIYHYVIMQSRQIHSGDLRTLIMNRLINNKNNIDSPPVPITIFLRQIIIITVCTRPPSALGLESWASHNWGSTIHHPGMLLNFFFNSSHWHRVWQTNVVAHWASIANFFIWSPGPDAKRRPQQATSCSLSTPPPFTTVVLIVSSSTKLLPLSWWFLLKVEQVNLIITHHNSAWKSQIFLHFPPRRFRFLRESVPFVG